MQRSAWGYAQSIPGTLTLLLFALFPITCSFILPFQDAVQNNPFSPSDNAYFSDVRHDKLTASIGEGVATPVRPSSSSVVNTLQPLYTIEFDKERWLGRTVVGEPDHAIKHEDIQAELWSALDVMQTTWFNLGAGDWLSAITWTGAVIHTHLSATLHSITDALHTAGGKDAFIEEAQLRVQLSNSNCQRGSTQVEQILNEINRFHAQSIAYYYGQDATEMRKQAYDDRLWVVLQWLESISFITTHSGNHFNDRQIQWYGTQFIEAYAHRARVFYALAHKGWDTHYCGGGMLWNPDPGPYKNAITNQLFITASIAMYLEYPGDNLTSPILDMDAHQPRHNLPFDIYYLDAAVEGYDWLKNSNMTNDKGLYTDGFHVTGWGKNGSEGTRKCDDRSKEIYTYNQAVVLSGLRGLWEATGNISYLEDGHELTRNAIAATGWSIEQGKITNDSWAGLGRHGLLEEVCDAPGECSRDSSSFKGIYFHHLTAFCQPLPQHERIPDISHAASDVLASLHLSSCREYSSWVEHNAKAALQTKDRYGRFGTWWGAKYADKGDKDGDPNDRGRGRSVEVQGSGVAVVRAWLEFGKLAR